MNFITYREYNYYMYNIVNMKDKHIISQEYTI